MKKGGGATMEISPQILMARGQNLEEDWKVSIRSWEDRQFPTTHTRNYAHCITYLWYL